MLCHVYLTRHIATLQPRLVDAAYCASDNLCPQAGDVWASSVFQHLVSWEPSERQCTSPLAQRIEKHSSTLQELFLQLQLCKVEERPALAYSLRSEFMSTFNALCTAEAPEPIRDSTFLSEPTQFSELADRSSLTSFAESLTVDTVVRGEGSDMGPEDPTFDHCLRPHTEFPTNASYINSKVKDLFFELEGGAKNKVCATAIVLTVYAPASQVDMWLSRRPRAPDCPDRGFRTHEFKKSRDC